MSTDKTDALVIRLADFSETSRVVTFFTREYGKISALAKGAKRLKGPFESALDLLSACRIVFIHKSSSTLDILTEAQLISRFRPAGKNLKNLYGGYYVAELLNGLTEEEDPHPELYLQAVSTLDQIKEDIDPTVPLLKFEFSVLREIGQLPAFDHCERCGQEVGFPGRYVFWVSQGGLLCDRCQSGRFQHNGIPAGTLAVLRQLTDVTPSDDSSDSSEEVVMTTQEHREIRRMATAAISHALGRRPKMLRFLNT